MSNSYQPWQVFTNEALRILKNKLVFLKGVNKDNQHLFAKPGMKSGSNINLRMPARFLGRTGETYSAEAYNETSMQVSVRPLQGVDIDLPSTEWTLNIDDVKKRILTPAMAQLVNNVERDCMQLAYQGVSNYVGTPGTALATSGVVLQAGAYLTNEGAPDDDTRKMLISPNTNVSMVPAFQGLFNPSPKIGKQFERGVLAKDTLGFDFYQTQNIWQHRIGPLGGTPAVNGANQTGSSLVTNGWSASAALRLRKGDIIEIANVNAVNPMTRAVYGGLRHFVVTADVSSDGSGNATIPIYPPIKAATDQFATVDALPANGALISVFSTAAAGQSAIANAYITQNLGFHGDAFTFAGISQEIPKKATEVAYEATDPDTGIQLRFVRDFETRTNNWVNRFDVLYAFGVPYGVLGCRMIA